MSATPSQSVLAPDAVPVVNRSAQDQSVNFIWNLGEGRALEARFVRRSDEYFIIYLSSHTGCNQSCRFCHLTATRQVSFDDATADDFELQASTVMDYYAEEVAAGRQAPAQYVNFNWMARGEPLLNPAMTHQPAEVLGRLTKLATAQSLTPNFNVSTIFPVDADTEALDALMAQPSVQLYYSLYSLEPAFRKRWLPKARNPEATLQWLAAAQARHGTRVALHWALIEGANDSAQTVLDIAAAVERSGLKAKFNLVRYNPYSEAQGREAGEAAINTTFAIMSKQTNSPMSRVVPRVGFDVKASCGMFIDAR